MAGNENAEESSVSNCTTMDKQHLIELAKMAQAEFFDRRQLEWRLAFATWTAIAVFTAAHFSKEAMNVSTEIPPLELAVLYLMFFGISSYCQFQIQASHWRGFCYLNYYRSMALGWESEASKYLAVESDKVSIPDKTIPFWGLKVSKVNIPWLLLHQGTTAFLLLLSWLFISAQQAPVPPEKIPTPILEAIQDAGIQEATLEAGSSRFTWKRRDAE